MELFSQPFIQAVRQVLSTPGAVVLGTIPVARGKPLALVEEIRSRSDVTVFAVSAASPAPASPALAARGSLGLTSWAFVGRDVAPGQHGPAGQLPGRTAAPPQGRPGWGHRGTQAPAPGRGFRWDPLRGEEAAAAVGPAGEGAGQQPSRPHRTKAQSLSRTGHPAAARTAGLWSLARRSEACGPGRASP